MVKAFFCIGSNQGNRIQNLYEAILLLSSFGSIIKKSSVYETEPWGFKHPINFLNIVIIIETKQIPEAVIKRTQEFETQIGRQRTDINGYTARKIDIDILFYNQKIIETSSLTIPHPRLHIRRFVMEPLFELVPDFVHPVFKKKVKELYNNCNDSSKVKKLKVKL